jgi:hypothetical protein
MGLDAPCVVLTWTWAISRSTGRALAFRPAAAMFLVVWSIYLADRLIDVARCRDWSQTTGRLRFGRRFRPLFWVCLVSNIVGIIAFLSTGLPADVLGRAMVVAAGVALYFLLFVVPVMPLGKLPGKEFGVGLFFALGAFACLSTTTHAIPLFVSVGLLVAYNCLVIAAKDAQNDQLNDAGAASHWWNTMARDLLWFGAVLTFAWAAAAFHSPGGAFFLSASASAAGLTTLHRTRARFSSDSVRALADFALFTPLAIFPVSAG